MFALDLPRILNLSVRAILLHLSAHDFLSLIKWYQEVSSVQFVVEMPNFVQSGSSGSRGEKKNVRITHVFSPITVDERNDSTEQA